MSSPGRQLSTPDTRVALAVALWVVLLVGLSCREASEAPAVSKADEFAQNREFISKQSGFYMEDAVIGHVHRPNLRAETVREEHPNRRIPAYTNNLGFRNDADTSETKSEGVFRILVSGDSHTDGLVWNSESFAHLIERGLAPLLPGWKVEVLNAGVGHYGPYHYGRLMKRYAALHPDYVIVNLFAGNDFMDAARLLEATTEWAIERPADYHQTLARAREQLPGATSQGLNQIFYFKHRPEMIEPVLENVVSELIALRRGCESQGAGLLVLVQPTKLDVEASETSRDLGAARELLDLDSSDLELNRKLTVLLVNRLRAAGIEALDLQPAMRESPEGLFWEVDHHLSVEGHRLLAVTILARYGSVFGDLAHRRRVP